MLDAAGLIEKHRHRGVLIDANLLVLFIVGLVNRNRIGRFKRVESYLPEDFDLLERLIGLLGPRIVATPHILSQVSDLTDLGGKERLDARRLLRGLIERIDEHCDPAKSLVSHKLFSRLGLADAGIELEIDSLNFNYVRALGWS